MATSEVKNNRGREISAQQLCCLVADRGFNDRFVPIGILVLTVSAGAIIPH